MLIKFISALVVCVASSQTVYPRLNIVVHSSETSYSHLKPLLEISEELSVRGHHVTLAARDDKLEYSVRYNLTRYSIGETKALDPVYLKTFVSLLKSRDIADIEELKIMGMTHLFLDDYDNVFMKLDGMIQTNRPDLMICDFASGACSDLSQKHGIPLVIGIQTIDVFNILPMPFMTKTMDYGPITYEKLSFLERGYYELIKPVLSLNFMNHIKDTVDKKKIQFGIKPKPSLMGDFNYGLVLANTYFGLEAPIPLPPNVKVIGPLMTKSTAEPDSNLQHFLDSNSRILYIGFGTVAIPSNQAVLTIIMACIEAIETNVIDGVVWGLSKTTRADFPNEIMINGEFVKTDFIFSNNHPKIRFLPWAPQEAILQHNSTVLYMTHGGLESFMESLSYAKPMLVVPFIGDQPRNAAKAELMGVGTFIDRHTMSKASLLSEITKWSNRNDMSIQFNVQRMKIISQRSGQRLAHAADLVEDHAYLAQACRPFSPYQSDQAPPCEMTHLIPASNFMPWYTKNNIDIYVSLALVLLFLGFALFRVLQLSATILLKQLTTKMKQS